MRNILRGNMVKNGMAVWPKRKMSIKEVTVKCVGRTGACCRKGARSCGSVNGIPANCLCFGSPNSKKQGDCKNNSFHF